MLKVALTAFQVGDPHILWLGGQTSQPAAQVARTVIQSLQADGKLGTDFFGNSIRYSTVAVIPAGRKGGEVVVVVLLRGEVTAFFHCREPQQTKQAPRERKAAVLNIPTCAQRAVLKLGQF